MADTNVGPDDGNLKGGVSTTNNDPMAVGARAGGNGVFNTPIDGGLGASGTDSLDDGSGDYGAATGATPPMPRSGTQSGYFALNNRPNAGNAQSPGPDRTSVFSDGDIQTSDTPGDA